MSFCSKRLFYITPSKQKSYGDTNVHSLFIKGQNCNLARHSLARYDRSLILSYWYLGRVTPFSPRHSYLLLLNSVLFKQSTRTPLSLLCFLGSVGLSVHFIIPTPAPSPLLSHDGWTKTQRGVWSCCPICQLDTTVSRQRTSPQPFNPRQFNLTPFWSQNKPKISCAHTTFHGVGYFRFWEHAIWL